MKIKELNEDKTIVEWMDILNASTNTARNYKLAFKLFTDFTDMTPEELLHEAANEIKNGIPMRDRKVKKHIVGFRSMLQDNKYAPGTIQAHLAGVKSFYREFDIELPRMSKASEKAQPLQKNQVIPTKDDIREVLKIADPMEKAIILIGLSSGLSAVEIINLRVSDFKNGYDKETGITTLSLRRQKVGFDFITFLTPEASQAVIEYMEYRNRKTSSKYEKEINEREKQKIHSDNDYLFCNRCVTAKYLIDHDDELRQFPVASLMQIYRRLSDKARKNTSNGAWSLIRSHNMRKMFYSTLLNGDCPFIKAEFMLGHKIPKTQAAYFYANVNDLKRTYSEFIPALTISQELELSKKVMELQNEQQSKVELLETKIAEMEKFQEAMAAIMADPLMTERFNQIRKV